MKILVADDNQEMRRLIRRMVSDLAETIYESADGGEAVAAYAEHRPDWALMDIKMKPVDGLAATREIKTRFPDARIIILTNYDDADLREEALRAGALEYIVKQRMVEMRRILTDAIGDRRPPCP